MSEASKEVFRSLADEVWNQKNAGSIEKYVSANYVGRSPEGDVNGLDGFRQVYATYTTAFPDCRIVIEQLLSEGDMVAFHYVFHGTHKGELAGIAPTGKSVSVHGVGISRLEGGKVAEDRVVWDTLSLMQQIGAA